MLRAGYGGCSRGRQADVAICCPLLKYSHPGIVVHLKNLFNSILTHGYVPDSFGHGATVPLLKNRLSDPSVLDNYRAVCFKVGRDRSKCFHNMRLGSLELEWVSDLKYLGIVFKTGPCLKVDVSYIKRKFYT